MSQNMVICDGFEKCGKTMSFGVILKNVVKRGHLGRFCKIWTNGSIWGDFGKCGQTESFRVILKNVAKWCHLR